MSQVNAALRQAAALLLGYPDEGWPELLDLVRTSLDELTGPCAAPLRRFCAGTAGTPVLHLAARYVTTFDRSSRRTLHLSYYADGDTPQRGASLEAWYERYRAHGWECPPDELPDYLPLVLEFTARCPEAGTELLYEHRGGLDLLRAALVEHGSPYAHVLEAVHATLPEVVGQRTAAAGW